MGLGYQQAVIELMNAEGDFVFGLLSFVASGAQIGGSQIVGGFDLEKFGQGLRERGAAGDDVQPTLIKNHRLGGNWSSAGGSQASSGDTDELGVGEMEEIAVVTEDRIVRAAGEISGVLFSPTL